MLFLIFSTTCNFNLDFLLNQITKIFKSLFGKPIHSKMVVPRRIFKHHLLKEPLPLPILEFLDFLVKIWFGHKFIQIRLVFDLRFFLPILPIIPSIRMFFFNLKIFFLRLYLPDLLIFFFFLANFFIVFFINPNWTNSITASLVETTAYWPANLKLNTFPNELKRFL